MYYNTDQLKDAYNKILRNSSSHSSCQLVIFVSCLNIDSLCAAKILSLLFKKQLVQLQLVPVFGYSELKSHYNKLDLNINSVIFIGCGGGIDLEEFLEIDTEAFVMDSSESPDMLARYSRNLYVLDTKRPWNLENIFGSKMINCFDDGTIDEQLGEQKDAYYKLLELDNNILQEEVDNNGELSEDEVATDNDGDGNANDNSNNNDDEKETDDGEQNDDEDDDIGLSFNASKDISSLSKKQKRKLTNDLSLVLEEYYSQGTTTVNSLSMQIYSLLSALGETNLQYLWLTILGATSLNVSYPQVYNRLFPILKDEVNRLSLNTQEHSSLKKTADKLTIDIQPDYYLFLLRYSSLYDSFFYSNYVNAKLSLWNENGKKRLHKMFARMGIPLKTAQESWTYMDNSIKRQLRDIFDKNLVRYGLQDIVKDGFVRTYGYRGSISASEYVEAITSLLEVGRSIQPSKPKTSDVTPYMGGEYDDNTNTDDEGNSPGHNSNVSSTSTNEKVWVSNFWLSWDTLDDRNTQLFKRGIKHSKILQKSVFNTGITILEKKLLKNLRIYRLCVLQDGPDLELYSNPLTLLRLGNWLIECCAELEDKQLLPMVLASLNESTDTYLVAGLAPRYPRGLDNLQSKKPLLNNFTMAFSQITRDTGAMIKIDNFESSIIEIHREDLSPFLEKLTLSGLV
ncbi:hypothetical protein TPHA_0C01020 [Tetrapisispora phaffii CBS 4417]|uniref:CDC45-like protein n=1 Tax=Tetrapisispora phaffii (strain ATCC 24235 / CBS 4417 / NBRC 1672 / NRRL Y-8282 / UCD 70-5) TaxID=1071381 RepID=G8BR82_TETPH|nr:hypothetical protein TPHA_0C01020 [Tetrapisispora phaffii CBS 4417]CCE62258.1 hypothetical protein TPHA_0C01020 [Tetrapisispora phaffii CBS 4417]